MIHAPHNLGKRRIFGRNRRKPCHWGRFYRSEKIPLDNMNGTQYMDLLVTLSKWELEDLIKEPNSPFTGLSTESAHKLIKTWGKDAPLK